MSDRVDKNIDALAESARLERTRVDGLFQIIRNLQESMTAMAGEIQNLRVVVATSLGHGASVKS